MDHNLQVDLKSKSRKKVLKDICYYLFSHLSNVISLNLGARFQLFEIIFFIHPQLSPDPFLCGDQLGEQSLGGPGHGTGEGEIDEIRESLQRRNHFAYIDSYYR